MDLKQIIADIEPEWKEVRKLISTSLTTDCDLLNNINDYLYNTNGKQIRPILGILSAKSVGEVSYSTIATAVASELIHNATLLHDDVADNSDKRRGKDTVRKLFSPAASVLTGDFWLARALGLVTSLNDNKILEYFVKAVDSLSEGELLQMDKAIKLDTTEADYYKIIDSKTASLFNAVICGCVYTTGASQENIAKMSEYAYHIGVAFQIRDDIFDYTPKLNTGKSAGIDIKEKKLTLPLLKALQNASKEEQSSILDYIKESNPESEGFFSKIMNFVNSKDGLKLAQIQLNEHCNKACDAISHLKSSVYKNHLTDLARYLALRES